MSRFLSSLGFATLTVVLSSAILVFVVNPPKLEPTASSVAVEGTVRQLSYEIRGEKGRANCIIWLHGLLSSRYEVLAISESVLKELDAFIVSIDRPGYGLSTLQPRRDFTSAVEDVAAVADAIGIHRFYVAGVSAGGSYAWATASLIPGRLRGVLLLSAAGHPGMLAGDAERSEFSNQPAGRQDFFRKMIQEWPRLTDCVSWFAETYVGGRALYSLWLEDLAKTVTSRMQNADARCLMRTKSAEYTLKVLPESLRQGVATPVIQDLLLILRPWPFNISSIPEPLASTIHIWHGSEDALVPADYARAFKERVASAKLHIVPKGQHHAYWVCDPQLQREALAQLIKSGLPR